MGKFVGQHRCSVDSKGRLVVPRKYFLEIVSNWTAEPNLVLGVMGSERCLALVNKDMWFEQRRNLEGQPWFKARPADIRRLNALVEQVEMDPQNRVTLPSMLRQLAGIEEEAVFVGCGDYIELWNAKSWEARMIRLLEQADELLEDRGPTSEPEAGASESQSHHGTEG